MAWVRLDDKFPQHPKVAGLSHAGFRRFIVLLCWCNQYETDGVIAPAEAKPRPGEVRELVAAGLLEIGEGGASGGRSVADPR